MPDKRPIYVIDTSSWGIINGHPAQRQIQDCIFELIDAKKIKVPPAVQDELERSEFIHPWLCGRYAEIVDGPINQNPDYLRLVGEVTTAFPGMASIRSRKTKADPWVVAYGAYLCRTKPELLPFVVADETIARRPNRKIPTACVRFGVDPLNMIEMLRKEFPHDGW